MREGAKRTLAVVTAALAFCQAFPFSLLTYEAAGRTTAIETGAGVTSLSYDYEGRVTGITYPNTSSDAFGYNGIGARTSTSGTNGSRTFLRAGLGVTSPVLSDGNADYTPGVSRRESSTTKFSHSGLKNANSQTNSSEGVSGSRVYDAFGNTVSSSGSWSGPYGYGAEFGYQEDANGLRLLGHRYYDSSVGRFTTSDPMGDGRNWYAYVSNSPIGNVDITGHIKVKIVKMIFGGKEREFWVFNRNKTLRQTARQLDDAVGNPGRRIDPGHGPAGQKGASHTHVRGLSDPHMTTTALMDDAERRGVPEYKNWRDKAEVASAKSLIEKISDGAKMIINIFIPVDDALELIDGGSSTLKDHTNNLRDGLRWQQRLVESDM